MMLRVTPEIFSAIEDLDRDGFVAITAARPVADNTPPPGASSPPSLPGSAPVTVAPSCSVPPPPPATSPTRMPSTSPSSSSSCALSYVSLEFHLLSKAFGNNGPRATSVDRWQLVIGWFFPKTLDGHHGDGSGSPPSAAEILHALDAARGTDPDLRSAIERGPPTPLMELRELVVNLRHHQKAAIHWMLGVEEGATTMNKPPSQARAEGVGAEDEGEGEGKGGEEEQEVGLLEAGAAADRRAASVASEKNAFLLGWVRLDL
ncbi:unnamed protein product, partial [Ectocarpus sp. 12 AP-2014]